MIKENFWEIPSSVDIEVFLKKYSPAFTYKIDHFYYIIDYLSRGMDQEDLDSNAGFINLNAAKLQKVNHDYKRYLDHLLKHRFILTDMKYIVGKKSYGFKLNASKNHNATVQQTKIIDTVLKKKKKLDLKEHQDKLARTSEEYSHLTKWFNDKLKIDVEGAKEKIEELFPKQTGSIRGTVKGKPSRWAKRYKGIYSIHKMANQEFYYSVDENVGRFHSNLTNIKKELRNYITYDGQKLVNVDIKSAQPLFSTLLFNPNFYQEKTEHINLFNFSKSLKLINYSFINKSHSSCIIMLVKMLQDAKIDDFAKYIKLAKSDKFYQKISRTLYPSRSFDKKEVKIMFYVIFFSSNRFIGQVRAKGKRDFKAVFPKVYEVFKIIKKYNHRALAHILQRIESTIMIQNVAKRIALEKPDLPIFTIHDSISTTVGNEEYVTKVIQEEIHQLTGLNAFLGLEYW